MAVMDAKAYAEHRQVSAPMVTKYLQQGMIPSGKRIGRKWKTTRETLYAYEYRGFFI